VLSWLAVPGWSGNISSSIHDDNSSRVGIGTTTPQTRLRVFGAGTLY
jgi:hypothetical protein